MEEYFLILYKTALATGLRANELRQLSVDDIHQEKTALILRDKWTKNRKSGLQPIPKSLYEELKEFAGSAQKLYEQYLRNGTTITVPNSPLLYVPQQVFRTITRHYKLANIDIETQEGVADFHALRVTFINLIVESGANSKTAQSLARHSSVDMTFNRYGRTKEDLLLTAIEQISSTIGAQLKNKEVVNPEGLTTYKVEHKGLEPKIGHLQDSDNPSKNQHKTNTKQTQHQHFTKNGTIYKTENYGQLSDNEKHIIDSFRAQYEHNEIPLELLKLIKSWSNIPEAVSVGILAMVDSCIQGK